VSGEDVPVRLGGPKQRTVLAHLILNANHMVPAERLIDALWGEEPPEAARGTVQAYVSRLRSALGSNVIQGRPPGYALRADAGEVDVHRFERLLREARATGVEPRGAFLALEEALELWRGPALADLASEFSLSGEIARLEELRLQATEDKIAAQLDLGLHAQSVAELEPLTRVHPLRERLWAELMVALYRVNRQADALLAFERARTVLAEELGINPSNELQELHERILRQDPDLELKGEPLRGYRLLERVGEGAFGVVYRATQPQIGREVAIKAVHPELANHPDFVRRFEREAQIVARLEHPHIVPLYDYWREPDGAFLVMRFLRGGSLEDLIALGPLDPERAAAILDQTAAGLAAAHRQGVVHRDVKPGNVLLDEEDNAYLSDFGVALDAGSPERPSGTLMRGTPAYLSPEQIRLEAATPQSDIYALGVVLYEMLTGRHPFPESSLAALPDHHLRQPLPSVCDRRPELPVGVDDVLATATAKDAAARFTDPLQVAAALRAALQGSAASSQPVREIRNPYKGLRAFLEADAGDFFGRETLAKRLVHRLEEAGETARFLAVVGPSGSGKSSVVRAGLVPALRRGALEGSDRWYVIEVLPGSDPFRELETALLGVAVEPPPSLLEDLRGNALGLVRAAERVLPDPDAEILIVIDQLEEVFTLVTEEDERTRLLQSLTAAVLEPASRIRIVATLRADFFDAPLSIRGFGELLAARTEAITPMAPEELERAIVGPAERAGLAVEPRLLAAMVADVADRPGSLPLLQYALTELAERGTDGVLTLEGYRRIGGVSGALARRAEQLFEAMNGHAQEACRQLFLRLVTLGEGSEDMRRRVPRSQLVSLAGAPAMDGVIDGFGRHRLLSFDRDPATREPTVEIAHEALLRAWVRLRGWIDDARDDLRVRNTLASSAAEWEAAGRNESFLLRGVRLEQAASWAAAPKVALSSADDEFLRASISRRDEETSAEEARQARERVLEQRSIRRLRGLVAALTAAILVASVLTFVATGQRGRARKEARIAMARELAASATANLELDPERSILLALQAVATTRPDGTVLRESSEALHRAVDADRLLFTIQNPSTANVAWSPDGRLLATGGTAGGTKQNDAMLWDARTGELVRRLSGHTGDVMSVAFSSDAARLVTTAEDGRAIVWDVRTGRRLLIVPGKVGSVFGASFSPDGHSLAIGDGGDEGGVRIVNAASGAVTQTIREQHIDFCSPSFSPDGSRITAGCSDGDLFVWSVVSGQRLLTIREAVGGYGSAVIYSPDGTRLAGACCDGAATIWDAQTGRKLLSLEGHTGLVIGMAWSADGTLLATGGTDGTARIWDATTGRQLMVLAGHAGSVAMVDFSPDGTRLLTGGGDGTARVWDVTPDGGSELLGAAEPNSLYSVAYSPDGSNLVTGGEGGGWLWDASTAERLRSYPKTYWAAFDPDGFTLVTAGSSGSQLGVRILDAASGEEIGFLAPGPPRFFAVAASPDGSVIATGSKHGAVLVWDRSTGEHLLTLQVLPRTVHWPVDDVAFSPDGKLVAGLAQDTLRVWDVSSGHLVIDLKANLGFSHAVAFSPDGRMIATSGGNGAAVWSVPSGERVAALTRGGSIEDVVFGPTGGRVATAGDDGAVRIWDVSSGRETLVLRGHAPALTAAAFSPDGTKLATTSIDGTLRVYVLPIDELVRLARSRLSRGFMTAECRQYLHVARCPASPGIASPAGAASTPPASGGAIGPEGAYRVTIAPVDFWSPLVSTSAAKNSAGQFTLSLVEGIWRLHQVKPNGQVYDTFGTYGVSGDRITLTNRADPRCFGMSWTGRWALQGVEVSFKHITSMTTPTCAMNDALVQTVFGSHPWTRVNHHELI
jgi:WD40 repeat protein/serine/threonine protein kinase